MSAAEVAEIKDAITAAINSVVAHVHTDLAGTMARVLADQPEIIGLRQYLRDTAAAIGGQIAQLPDGTKITSVGAAHSVEMSALAGLAEQLTQLEQRLAQLGSGTVPANLPQLIDAAVQQRLDAEFARLTGSLSFGVKPA